MGGIPSGYDRWLCPFCGVFAVLETKQQALCDSRTCSCGAIALAAPAVDTDEIIDDALGIFSVPIRDESHGYDNLLVEDICRAGIEVREGDQVRVREGFWGEYRCLWFRRPPVF